MYKRGDIFKLKYGNATNQLFIMLISQELEEFTIIILFDNIANNQVGDTTRVNFQDFEISSIRELSEFIINNNF